MHLIQCDARSMQMNKVQIVGMPKWSLHLASVQLPHHQLTSLARVNVCCIPKQKKKVETYKKKRETENVSPFDHHHQMHSRLFHAICKRCFCVLFQSTTTNAMPINIINSDRNTIKWQCAQAAVILLYH